MLKQMGVFYTHRCLGIWQGNPYEQVGRQAGLRIRVGLWEHEVRSNPQLISMVASEKVPDMSVYCVFLQHSQNNSNASESTLVNPLIFQQHLNFSPDASDSASPTPLFY